VRSKNMLSVLMQCLLVFSLVAVLWALYGYSFAFTENGPYFGGLDRLWARGLDTTALAATFTKGVYVPELAFFVFQGAFAGITCALIVGRASSSARAAVLGSGSPFLPADRAYGLVLPGPDAFTSTEAVEGVLAKSRTCGRRALDFAGSTVVPPYRDRGPGGRT
jgi:Amt family ammonium transporter